MKEKWLWASLEMEVEEGDELSFRNVSTREIVRARQAMVAPSLSYLPRPSIIFQTH